jgi:hypothetical protein
VNHEAKFFQNEDKLSKYRKFMKLNSNRNPIFKSSSKVENALNQVFTKFKELKSKSSCYKSFEKRIQKLKNHHTLKEEETLILILLIINENNKKLLQLNINILNNKLEFKDQIFLKRNKFIMKKFNF